MDTLAFTRTVREYNLNKSVIWKVIKISANSNAVTVRKHLIRKVVWLNMNELMDLAMTNTNVTFAKKFSVHQVPSNGTSEFTLIRNHFNVLNVNAHFDSKTKLIGMSFYARKKRPLQVLFSSLLPLERSLCNCTILTDTLLTLY